MRLSLTPILAALTLSLALTACAGSPSYAGGPTADDAHGIVDPGWDVSLFTVDGQDTANRHGQTYVAPGRRRLGIRIEHPLESDDWKPYENRVIVIDVVPSTLYTLDRKPGEYPPYEVNINQFDLR